MSWRSIRTLILIALISGAIAPQFQSSAQQSGLTPPPKPVISTAPAPGPSTGSPLRIGEKLTFNVSWSNFVTAGRLEAELVSQGAFFDRSGYQLRTRATTVGAVRTLFLELDDLYTSYVATGTMLPYRLVVSNRRGPSRADDTVIIDQARGQARFADGSTVNIPQNTLDLPSLLYALRVRDLHPGAVYQFGALSGREIIDITAESKGNDRVITQSGGYDAVRVDLTARTHAGDKYHARAYFTADGLRMPVLILVRLPFGEIRAELANVALGAGSKGFVASQSYEPPVPSRSVSPNEIINSVRSDIPSQYELNLPFCVGERLNYDVSWASLASVGKASFEVRQQGQLGDHRVFEMVGEVSTVGIARSMINVDTQLTSYVDAQTLSPTKTYLKLIEGRRIRQTWADFDWKGGTVKLSDGTLVKVQPQTLDLVSLFYNVRSANLKIGTSRTFAYVDANHRLRSLTVKAIKEETISSLFGPVATTQLDVILPERNFLVAQAYLTADSRRLPVYVAIRQLFGEVRFQLAGAVGTR
jgi:Protein of unknown function (DUF3108)